MTAQEPGRDLLSSLAELDRKLRELQDEVSGAAAAGPAPSPSRMQTGADDDATVRAQELIAAAEARAGAIVENARERVAGLSAQIEELTRLRDALLRTTRDLLAPSRQGVEAAAQRVEEIEREGAGSEMGPGPVALTAGPFADLPALDSFARSLRHIDRLGEVRIGGFEGRWAILEVELPQRLDLVGELTAALPHPPRVVDSGEGALTIALGTRDA